MCQVCPVSELVIATRIGRGALAISDVFHCPPLEKIVLGITECARDMTDPLGVPACLVNEAGDAVFEALNIIGVVAGRSQ